MNVYMASGENASGQTRGLCKSFPSPLGLPGLWLNQACASSSLLFLLSPWPVAPQVGGGPEGGHLEGLPGGSRKVWGEVNR
jgi:hypothetical protein